MRKLFPFVLIFCLSVSPSFAEGDDLAAVVQHCGAPSEQSQALSQVTNRMEHDLVYGRMILHFQPSQSGWSFLSGWYRHLPQTKKMVEGRMPCFAEAMAAAAAEGPAATAIDPTIRSQAQVAPADTSTFGIPHLWLILSLAVLVLVLAFMPGSRRRPFRTRELEKVRRRRRPMMERFLERRQKGSVDV